MEVELAITKRYAWWASGERGDSQQQADTQTRVLEDGAKVKAYVHFRGRTIVFKERGELLLLRFLKELEEYGGAENLPKMEGRRMNVIIAPHKKKKS